MLAVTTDTELDNFAAKLDLTGRLADFRLFYAEIGVKCNPFFCQKPITSFQGLDPILTEPLYIAHRKLSFWVRTAQKYCKPFFPEDPEYRDWWEDLIINDTRPVGPYILWHSGQSQAQPDYGGMAMSGHSASYYLNSGLRLMDPLEYLVYTIFSRVTKSVYPDMYHTTMFPGSKWFGDNTEPIPCFHSTPDLELYVDACPVDKGFKMRQVRPIIIQSS